MTDERNPANPAFGDPNLPPEETPTDGERAFVERAMDATPPTQEEMESALALAAARNGPTINSGTTVTIMDGEGVPAGPAPTQAEMQEMRREAIENDAAHDDPAAQAVHLEHQLETQFATNPGTPVPDRMETVPIRVGDAIAEVMQETPILSHLDPTRISGDRVQPMSHSGSQWPVPTPAPAEQDRNEADPEDTREEREERPATAAGRATLGQWTAQFIEQPMEQHPERRANGPRIRIESADRLTLDQTTSFGHRLSQLDGNTAYRVDGLSRLQLDTLRLHGVNYTILQQPDVEPPPVDPCFTIMVGQDVLSIIQLRLSLIFTGYSAVNDIEGVMGLSFVPYNWPDPAEDGDIRAMAADDETDQLDGTRATIIIADDLTDEPDPPDPPDEAEEGPELDITFEAPPEQPLDPATEALYENFPLRRPFEVPPDGSRPAYANFIGLVNNAVRNAQYGEIVTFDDIVLGIASRRNRPLYCLVDDIWPMVDGMEIPATLNQIEEDFNSLADDDEYEEIERLAHIYCYSGHFSKDDMEAMLHEYDIDTSMPEPLPFYYYHFVLMAATGVYARAQELGMSMMVNRFIEIAANAYGDTLSADRMNTIMHNVAPLQNDIHAPLQNDMHTIPELEPETPEDGPEPTPNDPQRAPLHIDTEWDEHDRLFIHSWNSLLASCTADELDTLSDLYGGRRREPLRLTSYDSWPEEWFPGLTTAIEEAEARIVEYISDSNQAFVLPYCNMLAGTSHIDELELDAILEREGFDVTEIGQQGLYMFPVMVKMYMGYYLEAAANAVKMCTCPFTRLLSDKLGDEISAGEMNITMGLLTDQSENIFHVHMEERPGRTPTFRVLTREHSTNTRVAALHQAALEPKKPEEPKEPQPLDEGLVVFSNTKAPVHSAFNDEDTDYWQIAESTAESLGINLIFMARDAPNIKPFAAGSKQHRQISGHYADYNPTIVPGLSQRGMVTDNTVYIHVYARPHKSIIIKKLTQMPDWITIDLNLTGEGDPMPREINQMQYGDKFADAKYIRYNLLKQMTPAGDQVPATPTLRADYRMDGPRTWSGLTGGDLVLARFTDPQNVFVNFQMLRFDSEASFLLYEHIVNWISRMVYFDVWDVHGSGLAMNGAMRWSQTAERYIANDANRLYEKRVGRYINNFKSTVIGDLPALIERADKIQGEIASLTSALVLKAKEQESTNGRISAVRKKDGEFSTTLKAEIDAIEKMEGIQSFKINTDGLTAETEYLLLHDERTDDWYELGHCSITLLNKGELKIINRTRQCDGLKQKMNHPHVYPGGGPCLGDLTKTIPNYFSTASISALVDIALQLLVNVNSADTAGAYVTKWPKCGLELQKFLDKEFKSKFQAGRIGHATYKQHLIDKEKKANVSTPIQYGTPTTGGSGFPSDEELEAAAFIDAAGNITPGPSHSGQAPAGGRDPGAPASDNSGIQIAGDGELRARTTSHPSGGQLLPTDNYTGTDG